MIIAIAGVSQAGKSTLANRLRELLGSDKTTILCQDEFVKDVDEIPVVDGHIDWEHPDAIDHRKLYKAIEAEAKRSAFVIAEGLMILWDEPTRKLFDKCIFLHIDKQTFVERKKKDVRWGIEPEWYVEHIWQSHLRYGQLPQNIPHLAVDGCAPFDISLIISYLNT